MQQEAVAVPVGALARVAVFVDGDNLPPSLAAPILAAADRLGRADLRRVYAADASCKGWDAAAGFRVSRVAGAKNGTDLLLCIEAVAAVCDDRYDRIVVASDDRDFSHLAHWLRERGVHVLGLGTARSPRGWRAACTEFSLLAPPAAPPAPPAPPPPGAALSEIDRRIRAILRASPTPDVLGIGQLGASLGSLHKMTLQAVGLTAWRDHLAARPDLYELDPKGPQARVRWIGP